MAPRVIALVLDIEYLLDGCFLFVIKRIKFSGHSELVEESYDNEGRSFGCAQDDEQISIFKFMVIAIIVKTVEGLGGLWQRNY